MINLFSRKNESEVETTDMSFPSLESTVKHAMEDCKELANLTKVAVDLKLEAIGREMSDVYVSIATMLQRVDKTTQLVEALKHDLPSKLMERCDDKYGSKDEAHGLSSSLSGLKGSVDALSTSMSDHDTALVLLTGKVDNMAILIDELRRRPVAAVVQAVVEKPRLPILSERQQQIYDLLKAGNSQVDAATQLGIAQASVAGHVAAIRQLGYSL